MSKTTDIKEKIQKIEESMKKKVKERAYGYEANQSKLRKKSKRVTQELRVIRD